MPEWNNQAPGGAVAFNPPPGFPGQPQGPGYAPPYDQQQGQQVQPYGQVQVPSRGVFSISETVPIIQRAATEMEAARQSWVELRQARDHATAAAKNAKHNLIVKLRVLGNQATGNFPIKTSAERQEWAAADPEVQRLELEADLAQTVQMAAYEAYQDKQSVFESLRSMLGMERDDLKREHHGPPS